jgi:hypothetical protein
VEEVIAFLPRNLEADETLALSRDNWLLTLTITMARKSWVRIVFMIGFLSLRILLPGWDLLAFVSRSGRLGRRYGQVKPLTQKFQQFLRRVESQLRGGINFLNPAFESAFCRLRFWS